MTNPLLFLAFFPVSILDNANMAGDTTVIDMSGVIVRLLSFLLGICGATYLAAGLWSKSEKGSHSWKYLSVSMILFVFWNIIGAFGILLDMLIYQNSNNAVSISQEDLNIYIVIFKIFDPIIEVIVFVILLFGLRKIISTMRTTPWTVFSKVEEEEIE